MQRLWVDRLKAFKSDARELTFAELQELEDRFMYNFNQWSPLVMDRQNPRNHILRLHYQATVDLLLRQGLINTGNDGDKGNKT